MGNIVLYNKKWYGTTNILKNLKLIRSSFVRAVFELIKKMTRRAKTPGFNPSAVSGTCPENNGLAAYYSNRCPYAEYHVVNSLVETARKRNISLKTIKLETMAQAQAAPTPATIFSLFYNGKFATTDISVCMDSRFDKIMSKNKWVVFP